MTFVTPIPSSRLLGALPGAIVHHHGVAGIEEIAGHGKAHVAQTDECDVHGR
jgi:hypothetical protein